MKTIFISIGCSCIVKQVLKDLNLTIPERLPFDWCGSDSDFISNSLKTDFKFWESPDMFYTHSVHKGNDFLHIKNRNGNTGFIHDVNSKVLGNSFNPSEYYDSDGFCGDIPTPKEVMNDFVESYQRRIKRFRDLINSEDNLIFVWHDYRNNFTHDIIVLWNSLNIFTKRPFTLICLEYTDKIYGNINVVPNNDLTFCFGRGNSRCLAGTYYNGEYNGLNATPIFKEILLKYIRENI